MLLDEQSPKYLGNDEGMLNLELMKKLHHVVAYNIAKSRAERDGNDSTKKMKEPEVLKPGDHVLVRDKLSKAFQPKYLDFVVVKLEGQHKVIVKDNHGHESKVCRDQTKRIDTDVKIQQLYEELRQGKYRDAIHCMPLRDIPDLRWDLLFKEEKKKNAETASQEKIPQHTKTEQQQEPEPEKTRQGPVLRSHTRNKEGNSVAEIETEEEIEHQVETQEITIENLEEISVDTQETTKPEDTRNEPHTGTINILPQSQNWPHWLKHKIKNTVPVGISFIAAVYTEHISKLQ